MYTQLLGKEDTIPLTDMYSIYNNHFRTKQFSYCIHPNVEFYLLRSYKKGNILFDLSPRYLWDNYWERCTDDNYWYNTHVYGM